jgi:spore maturation protein CgeB
MSGHGLRIAFFGASLASAGWTEAARYSCGILRALHARGHRITLYQPALAGRARPRDMPPLEWARERFYPVEDTDELERCLEEARGADVVVKTSGVGLFDAWLDARVVELRSGGTQVFYWDLEPGAMLERLVRDPRDAFRQLVPRYDGILTQGGGDRVVGVWRALGARACTPVYSAMDPEVHRPVRPQARFGCSLAFLEDRLPDLEERMEAFFLRAADLLPDEHFLLGGVGWASRPRPANVHYLGHVPQREHNALRGTARTVLDVSREGMARAGYSPTSRLFEAAGVGACLITDAWEGIERFLEPGRECLVAQDGLEVAEGVLCLTDEGVRELGQAARRRVLAEHTYAHRARHVELLWGHSRGAGPTRVWIT